MSIDIRPIVEDELERYMELCQMAFGGKPEEGEAERVRRVIGLERVHAAFDGDRMVATDGAYSLRLSVPGTGSEQPGPSAGVASAGLTRVAVAATHRRRGVLTGLIAAHFADAASRGEPLSTLWASELPIYGRFGFGPASDAVRASFHTGQSGIRRPDEPDELGYADEEEARQVLPGLREQGRLGRPGQFHRTPTWWDIRSFADHEFLRGGASPRRTVIARRDGQPVGYVTFRQAPRWTDHDLPDGEIKVEDFVGLDRTARHSLWWFLSTIDLHPRISTWSLPTDTELPWLADNQRAVIRHLTDGLQVRVLDPVAALEGRRYAEPGQLTFALLDDSHPAASGTFRLVVADDGTGSVERTDDEPEVRLQPAALGALYLGSRQPEPLVVAGWLDGDEEAWERAGRLFAWPVAAWCDELF